MKYFLSFLFGVTLFFSQAQSIEGIWETYDDETGEMKSEVRVYIKEGRLFGEIVELHNLKIPLDKAKCYDCTDYRKDQPVMGMEIISGLSKDGKYWTADKVLLDPNNGKVYDAKLWLINEDKLAVRGYIGWFYRTQYWKRK